MGLDENSKIAYKVLDQNNSKFINIVGYSYYLTELCETKDFKYDFNKNIIVGPLKEWELRGVTRKDIEQDLKNAKCFIL